MQSCPGPGNRNDKTQLASVKTEGYYEALLHNFEIEFIHYKIKYLR